MFVFDAEPPSPLCIYLLRMGPVPSQCEHAIIPGAADLAPAFCCLDTQLMAREPEDQDCSIRFWS